MLCDAAKFLLPACFGPGPTDPEVGNMAALVRLNLGGTQLNGELIGTRVGWNPSIK